MRKLLNGNQAFAYGCFIAKVSFFAGYPITPSTDVYEFFEKEMPMRGGTFVAAESELAAVNTILGATIAGARAVTVSSGCGFSLMQEGISYAAGDFVPLVLLNVMREGAGLGDIPRSQGDYDQMTKGGGNGDYHCIVLSCSSMKDCVEAPAKAFELAEKYMNPVIVTYDSDVAHTMEYVDIPDEIFDKGSAYYDLKSFSRDSARKKLKFVLSGENTPPRYIQNVYYHNKDYDRILADKYDDIEKNCQVADEYRTEDAEIIFVAFSTCNRICLEVVDVLRDKEIKAGLITPVSLYPFPSSTFAKIIASGHVKKFVCVELNILKQMTKDIEYAVKFRVPVETIHSMSTCPTVDEIVYSEVINNV